jgi:hypothetical protein
MPAGRVNVILLAAAFGKFVLAPAIIWWAILSSDKMKKKKL